MFEWYKNDPGRKFSHGSGIGLKLPKLSALVIVLKIPCSRGLTKVALSFSWEMLLWLTLTRSFIVPTWSNQSKSKFLSWL